MQTLKWYVKIILKDLILFIFEFKGLLMKNLSLNGIWKMTGGGYEVQGKIPGSIYSFLKENKLLVDPFYRLNETEVFNVCNNDFTFERYFDYGGDKNERAILCFDGLDTVCEVYLNGSLVLSSKNMHISHQIEVGGMLLSKNNHLKVICYSATKYVDEAFKKRIYFKRGLI